MVSVNNSNLAYVKVITPTVHELADHALHLEKFADMGLDVTESPPWAVYINDLGMICELVRSPAELICYLRWRDRLHLGRTSIAPDEADVFGAFLLRQQPAVERPTSSNIMHIGSHSTDFDAYYLGRSAGPAAEKPGMFSIPLVDRFVDRLVIERPDGWLDAADVVLTLTLEQLAFVDHAGPLLAKAAASDGQVISHAKFGVTVVGLPPSQTASPAEGTEASGSWVYITKHAEAELVWASYGAVTANGG